MLVLKIKNYIIANPKVSIAQISNAFALENEQVRSILAPFIEKGKINVFKPTNLCGSCSGGCGGCTALNMELYNWNETMYCPDGVII